MLDDAVHCHLPELMQSIETAGGRWVQATSFYGGEALQPEIPSQALRVDAKISAQVGFRGHAVVPSHSAGDAVSPSLASWSWTSPPHATVGDSYTALFKALDLWLTKNAYTPDQLFRTWLYAGNILADYGSLNAARDVAFDHWGLRRYPASTGIQVRSDNNDGVVVRAYAQAVTGGATWKVLDTTTQMAPRLYGPRFSRAAVAEVDGLTMLSISGISSISKTGQSLPSDDITGAVVHTIASFQDLLAMADMSWEDLVQVTAYVANSEVARAFADVWPEEALRPLTLPAQVCRPDLHFEIEALAVHVTRTYSPQPIGDRNGRNA